MKPSLTEKINKARAKVPQDEAKKEIPPNSFKISGFWEKGNKEKSSWVAKATGVKINEETEREQLELEFVPDHSIEWVGKKGEGNPRGFKTWYLGEGVYKAKITTTEFSKPEYLYFAVVDGNREDLSEQELFLILAEK